MAVLGVDYLTLGDAKKFLEHSVADVAEILRKAVPIVNDIPYVAMNKKVKHLVALRSDLPTVYYRKANQAVPASKTTIEEREFVASHFESKSVMDQKVAEYGGKDRVGANRLNQAEGHIQAAAHELADLILYGSPEEDHRQVPGIFHILSTLNPAEPTSNQIIDAGGLASDNASILFVSWGPKKVYGIFEEGTQAGLKRTDRGLVQIPGTTESGGTGWYWGFEEDFEVEHGLCVADYRALARVANIDVQDLKVPADAANLMKLMTRALYRIPPMLRQQKGKVYVNSTIMSFLDEQAQALVGAGGGLTYSNYQGEQVLMFRGWMIQEMDNLLNTEARVVA
jgi:hypothetical protein